MTLHWPPASPEHLSGCRPWPPDPGSGAGDAGYGDRGLPDPPGTGLSDPLLIAGVAEITAMMATQLGDGASPAAVMPVIRETARRWLQGQVRAGLLPASAGGHLEELAAAVHDQRYELGPITAYLRDPQVENVDVNGCDQNLPHWPTNRLSLRAARAGLRRPESLASSARGCLSPGLRRGQRSCSGNRARRASAAGPVHAAGIRQRIIAAARVPQ